MEREVKTMKYIGVYDIEEKKLEQFAEAHDTTVAEVIEALCEFLDDIESDF